MLPLVGYNYRPIMVHLVQEKLFDIIRGMNNDAITTFGKNDLLATLTRRQKESFGLYCKLMRLSLTPFPLISPPVIGPCTCKQRIHHSPPPACIEM